MAKLSFSTKHQCEFWLSTLAAADQQRLLALRSVGTESEYLLFGFEAGARAMLAAVLGYLDRRAEDCPTEIREIRNIFAKMVS